MDTALNKVLAALPDDTKVYVCLAQSLGPTSLLINIIVARSRVYERQRQVRCDGQPVGCHQEAGIIRNIKQADTGQIHHW